ncbi:hypothetical protein [Owenweeksia hongkongensis]|uniref:hypothetical protein n=1 Tax=Owenweeksia hongkongensis TaxID=253245 RepID=UPI003A9543FE
MDIYLNSFTPLYVNRVGRQAASQNNIPPFVDGSCRREPDFENPFPAISELCRPKKFISRLSEKDIVIYITKASRYKSNDSQWSFVAALEVIKLLNSHEDAVEYYEKMGVPVSHNIMYHANEPLSWEFTHGICGFKWKGLNEAQRIRRWNHGYKERAQNNPLVAICKPWEGQLHLDNPPVIDRNMMKKIFRRIPGTQNPPKFREAEWERFKSVLNI